MVHNLQHIKRSKKAISAFEWCITWSWYHLVFFHVSFPRPSEERRVPAESLEWLADEVSLAWSEVWGRKKTDFSSVESDFLFFLFQVLAIEVNIFHEKIGVLVESEKQTETLGLGFFVDICNHR